MKRVASIVSIVSLLVITVFVFGNRETKVLDEKERQIAGLSYAKLQDGVTHYEKVGEGECVLLIHGTTIPMWDYDFQVSALTNANFMVLRYDQYGRGYSDRVKKEYNRDLYTRQINELLECLQITNKIHIVGHSFGGALATYYASQESSKVKSLILLSPVVHLVKKSAGIKIVGVPVLGEVLTRFVLVPTTARRQRMLFSYIETDKGYYASLYTNQLTYKGFERAILSMFRSKDALRNYYKAYEEVGKTDIDVLVVWGNEDPDISRENIDFITNSIRNAHLEILDGMKHSPNLQNPAVFNKIMLDFLKKER